MALKISQDTFDIAVQENINDLGMEPEEALEEAVTQFQKQGVNLDNIVKEINTTRTENIEYIKTYLNKIAELCNTRQSKETSADIVHELKIVKDFCDKDIHQRVVAGKAGAYGIILNLLEKHGNDKGVRKSSLRTLTSLMTKQPDLLTNKGIDYILISLKDTDEEVQRLTLKWIKECCALHEINRQKFFEYGKIVDYISETLKIGHYDLIKETLAVSRALVLDDDVRVEFGKAHEHARIIASETLCHLVALLNRYKYDETVINEIILTFSTLLVRTEFCQKVEDAGGLDNVGEVLKHFPDNDKIVKNSFKFFKTMAGNDACKAHIIQKKLAPVLANALDKNKDNVSTAVAGLGCVAALTLRCPENSKAFFETEVPTTIYEIMKLHRDEKSVQKTASWAIRNMVSRCRDQSKTFLKLGMEELLKDNLKRFKEIEYDTKAALRDLGCKVHLKEEWTGKGGMLHTDNVKKQ